jgi:hypothetical protein
VTVPEEGREIEIKAESDAAKIINLVNQPLTRWPQEIGIFNGVLVSQVVLKAKSIAILGLRELGGENADKSLAEIVDELKLAYGWVDEGMQIFQGDMDKVVANIPQVFFLDFFEKSLPEKKVPKEFYRSYFLLALVELVSFEELRLLHEELDDCHGAEKEAGWYKKSIVCLSALIRAQSAVELGSDSLERSLGNKRFTNQLAVLSQYAPAMKAQDGRDKSNQARKEDSRNKKRPLLREIHQLYTKKKLGVTEATGKVAAEHGFDNQKEIETLRHAYYEYLKDPDKY